MTAGQGQYGGRKIREGTVVSDKMQKTVVVAVRADFRHPLYKKTVRRVRRLMAHDEREDARMGDRVRIVESSPLSARKRWRVIEVLTRAELPEVAPESIDLDLLGEAKRDEAAEAPAAVAEAAEAAGVIEAPVDAPVVEAASAAEEPAVEEAAAVTEASEDAPVVEAASAAEEPATEEAPVAEAAAEPEAAVDAEPEAAAAPDSAIGAEPEEPVVETPAVEAPDVEAASEVEVEAQAPAPEAAAAEPAAEEPASAGEPAGEQPETGATEESQ